MQINGNALVREISHKVTSKSVHLWWQFTSAQVADRDFPLRIQTLAFTRLGDHIEP